MDIQTRIKLYGINSLSHEEAVEALSPEQRQKIIDEGHCCSFMEWSPRNTDGSVYTGRESPDRNWQGLPKYHVCKHCGDVVQEGYHGLKKIIDIHERLRQQ